MLEMIEVKCILVYISQTKEQPTKNKAILNHSYIIGYSESENPRLHKVIITNAINVETAAPIEPKRGMSRKLKIMFVVAPMMTARDCI